MLVRLRRSTVRSLRWMLAISTLAQIPATAAFFAPHPDIAPDVALNDGPFSTTFQIINAGIMPMLAVRAACEPSTVLRHQGSTAVWRQWDVRLSPIVNRIPSGQAASFICPATDIEVSPDSTLGLVIKVMYRAWLFPFDRTIKRGFALTLSQGKWHWLRQPVKESSD
jgi:hypothetical protein